MSNNNINTTVSNETLKEYYVKLQGMYESCFNMLTAMNQSLMTNASEITVDMVDSNNGTTTLRIPSFMYLENKLEQLDSNFSNLFDLPNSGEAWFNKSSNMYKLKMVRSSSAPVMPLLGVDDVYAGSTANNILKDLVSPKTYIRLNVNNLPENIDQMFMRKIVLFDKATYDSLAGLNISTYDEYAAALYNYNKGEDYEEYDSVIKMPIKKDTYKSRFNILEIPVDIDSQNPWVEDTGTIKRPKLSYKLVLDTLEYSDEEDSSIRFSLKPGDQVCLGNEMVVYLVKHVDTTNNSVIIEEQVGHIALQTFEENSAMQLTLYNETYGKYKYVDVPLEENQYIVVFLGVIYNNVRSLLSDAYQVDLSTIYMRDEYGNPIKDSFGNPMTYMDYYRTYCTNIGDLILGLTQSAYPQISNYNGVQLNNLQSGEDIQRVVTSTINAEEILQVVPINKHLTDDVSSEEIINLHAQKNDVQAQLATIQDNISQVYNTLTNTDFSQETSNTMQSLQSKLNQYYTERTSLQKQLNSIIDNINSKALDVSVSSNEVKYRIRGLAVIDDLEALVKGNADDKVDIIGLDVEYKYKSTTKDTNSVTIINSSTFTDWNKLYNIDRQRELVFDTNIRSFRLDFVDYKMTDNVIKWNQIDIPIQAGEDVIIRVRYKYNIGQPFVNLYSPWSDELTVTFPPEYRDDVQMTNILSANQQDTIVAGFRKILIDEGYEEHITNKLVSSDQIFFHMPENIYSGFNTPENNLISLKDKLLAMSQDIEQYKSWVEGETNNKYAVYLQYDEQTIELTPNNINKINIYNTDHITGSYIKKDINLIIKNTGETRVNFYSIFPGNIDTSLLKTNISSFSDNIGNYERVPLIIDNMLSLQNLGQWIYFRQNNPYTKQDIYYNTPEQRSADSQAAISNSKFRWLSNVPREYLMSTQQVLLGYRNRMGTIEAYNDAFTAMSGIFSDCMYYMLSKDNAGVLPPGFESLPQSDEIIKNEFGDNVYWTIYDKYDWVDEDWVIKDDWDKGYEHTKNYDEVVAWTPKYEEEDKFHPTNIDIMTGNMLGDNKETYPKYVTTNDVYSRIGDRLKNWLPDLYNGGWSNDIYTTFTDNDFKYDNTIYQHITDNSVPVDESNRYLIRYQDIVGKNQITSTYVYLDNKTSITTFLQNYRPQGFGQEGDFSGAFLYPNLLSRQTIITDGAADSHIYIDKGEQLSIPLVFEYYLDGTKTETIDNTRVTKSLYFDLRNSLIKDPVHYMIEITGNYDLTATGDMYGSMSGVSLQDNVTEF